jgi:hypothetical protein
VTRWRRPWMRDRLTGCEVTYPRGFSSARLLICLSARLIRAASYPRD